MSTKYPTDFDDGVTLGPTFIDVVPPADPQRNIAAEFRNNSRDAIIAVQTRVGKTDDPSSTSIDWGLLSVSGSPNQGVRFAGTHALWPGTVSESGIFVANGTGNVSYHKSGDPIGTFTDLTGGGGSTTWDAIYAVDKSLDIDSTPLVFNQTGAGSTGYAFQVLRYIDVTSTSALVKIFNQHLTDTQACLEFEVNSPNAYFIQANYPGGGAGDEFFVDHAGNVGLKGELQRIVNGNLTVSTSNGNIILDAGASDLNFQGHSGGLIPFNAASPDDVLVGFTATSVVGALNEVKAYVPTWDDIYAVDQSLTINGAPLAFTQPSPNTNAAFSVTRNIATTGNSLVQFSCTNAAASHPVLELSSAGTTGTALFALGNGVQTGTVNVILSGFLATGALTTADVNMYSTAILANAGDTAGATYRGYHAVGSTTGSAVKHGFVADANWDYGLRCESRAYLTDGASSTNPVLELDQGTAGLSFTDYIGTEAASQSASISSIQGDGGTVVGPLSKSSIGWQFAKMVKVEVNGSPYYLCAYEPAP